MFQIRRLITTAALALCAALPTVAMAQSELSKKNVLLLTNSSHSANHSAHPHHAFKEATEQLGGTYLDPAFSASNWRFGALTSTEPSVGNSISSAINKADVVVLVASGDTKIVDDTYNIIKGFMENSTDKDRTFILFSGSADAGIREASKQFYGTIKAVTGWDDIKLAHVSGGSYVQVPFFSETEKNNPGLAALFSELNKDANGGWTSNLHCNTYATMQCVPKSNVLYGRSENRCQRSRFNNSNLDAFVVPDGCPDNMEDWEDLEQSLGNVYFSPRSNNPTPSLLTHQEIIDRTAAARDNNRVWIERVLSRLHPDAATSIIIPQWQSKKVNSKNKACIIFTVDEHVFDRQGKQRGASCSTPTDDEHPCPSKSESLSVFDHYSQQLPLAKALLKAAVDKDQIACRQPEPAESVLVPPYNGAPYDSFFKPLAAIEAGGLVSGDYSDSRDHEVPNGQLVQGGACTEGKPCRSFPNRGQCCSEKVDPSATYDAATGKCSSGVPCSEAANQGKCCFDLDAPSCPTNYMYCEPANVGTSQALNKKVCCSEEKTAQNSAGNLCCDADNPQPTGEPGNQICCKAGQVNESGKCVTPPTPICTEGQAISTGCTCQSPMVAQNGVCISSTPACKPPTGCSDPSAPTTDWPALLGLSALLPLLAARRRRRK